MSSNSAVGISPTPSRNRRQEETFRRVLVAAREMLRESSYADLTVRAVAKRANVAPATAYTYFSSKNHLVAEVYLDLVNQAPYFTDVNDTLRTRVDSVLRHLTLVVADELEDDRDLVALEHQEHVARQTRQQRCQDQPAVSKAG